MCLVFRIVRLRDINRFLAKLITTTGCFVVCDFLRFIPFASSTNLMSNLMINLKLLSLSTSRL